MLAYSCLHLDGKLDNLIYHTIPFLFDRKIQFLSYLSSRLQKNKIKICKKRKISAGIQNCYLERFSVYFSVVLFRFSNKNIH